MSWIKNIILVLVSLGVSLLLAEYAYRMYERVSKIGVYSYPQGIFVPDPRLGARLKENFDGVHSFEDLTYDVSVNSDGCFEKEVSFSSDIDILILGDSHSWGYVEQNDRFSDVLRNKFDYKTYNCAVTGTSTKFQYFLAQELIAKGMRPNSVVIGYLPFNDLGGDVLFPQLSAIEGFRVSTKIFDKNFNVIDAKVPEYWKLFMVNNISLVRAVIRAKSFFGKSDGESKVKQKEALPQRIIYHIDQHPQLVDIHIDTWKQFSKFLGDLDIPLYVYVIPSSTGNKYEDQIHKKNADYLIARLKDENIKFISTEVFRKNSHHKINDHMDKRGHLRVATDIMEFFSYKK